MPICKIKPNWGRYGDCFEVPVEAFDTVVMPADLRGLGNFVSGQMIHNGGFMLVGGRPAFDVFVSYDEDVPLAEGGVKTEFRTKMMLFEANDGYHPTQFRLRSSPALRQDRCPEEGAVWCYAAQYFLEWAMAYWEKVSTVWFEEDLLEPDEVLGRLERALLKSDDSPWGTIFLTNTPESAVDPVSRVECEMHERELIFMDGSLAYLTADEGPVATLEGGDDTLLAGIDQSDDIVPMLH